MHLKSCGSQHPGCEKHNMDNAVEQSPIDVVKRSLGPVLGLALVYIIFLLVAPDSFSSLYNSKNVLTQSVIIGIGALGMTVVIISAGIDLSAGSLIALGTVVTATVLRDWGTATPGILVPLVAAGAGIIAATLSGFISGAIISWLRIVPFIVTLGMMQIARGVAKGIAHQTTVNTYDNWLNNLMIVEPSPGVWYSVAPGVWIMIVLMLAMIVVLRYTVFGRYVYAIGSNEATARLCGIRVEFHRVLIYSIGGFFAGIAAVMQFSNLTLGDPTAAVGMELDIIAAVVIGGGSLHGGEGSVVGSVIGAVIMAILRNGCTLVGIPNYVQNIVIGAIIIAAVGADHLKHLRVT
jgi:ribose/xylose/arabinose/galactoside ABC-type transport system permease subunit